MRRVWFETMGIRTGNSQFMLQIWCQTSHIVYLDDKVEDASLLTVSTSFSFISRISQSVSSITLAHVVHRARITRLHCKLHFIQMPLNGCLDSVGTNIRVLVYS
jgi:hypothetical protein